MTLAVHKKQEIKAYTYNNLLISNLHFCVFTPNTCKIIDTTIRYFCRLFKYNSCLSDLFMFFVKFSELHPKCMRLACGLLRLDGLHSFSIRVNDIFWLAFKQLHSFMPFVNIMRILTKKNTENVVMTISLKNCNDILYLLLPFYSCQYYIISVNTIL